MALPSQLPIGSLQIPRVPEDDSGDEQVEAGRAKELVLEGAVAHLAKPAEVDGACKRIPGLALIETEVCTSPQIGVLDPIEREQGALDAADLAQCLGKPVLARIGRQLLQDCGGRGGPGADRSREPQQLV